jgi:hypothetical protein
VSGVATADLHRLDTVLAALSELGDDELHALIATVNGVLQFAARLFA